MQMADIKKVHMQDILDGMNHMSEESQGKVKSIFKNAFKYCIENDIVTKDYSQFLVITPPKKKKAAKEKFFTAEELGAVFGSQDFAVQFLLARSLTRNCGWLTLCSSCFTPACG